MVMLLKVRDLFTRFWSWVTTVEEVDYSCPTCEVLKEQLTKSEYKRDYYEQLLLTKSGILRDEEGEILLPENFQSIHRINTLSNLRQAAQGIVVEKHRKDGVVPVDPLTEAEIKFQQALDMANGKDN